MKIEHLHELCETIAAIKNRTEVQLLLKDLLSPKELESVVERLQIVKMLHQRIPQREISAQLGVSIAKITRGSKALKRSSGGFSRYVWQRKRPSNPWR